MSAANHRERPVADLRGAHLLRGSPKRAALWSRITESGYTYISPAILVLLLVLAFPLFYALYLSFTRYNLVLPFAEGFTLENYSSLLRDERFLTAFKNTFLFTIAAVATELVLGMGIALLLNTRLRGIKFFQLLMIVPLMVSPAVSAVLWKWLFNPDWGLLNHVLGWFGVGAVNWTGQTSTALMSLVIADVWRNTSFVVLILLAGLVSLPSEPLEAAKIDGASGWQTFRYVMVPALMPVVWVAVLFRVMDSLRVFELVYILTGGGPGTATESVTSLAYEQGLRNFNMGQAAAVSYVLFAVLALVSLGVVWLRNRSEAH
jgi:multiple sugar transport system permease protein